MPVLDYVPSAQLLDSGLYLSSTLESIVIPAGLLVTIATNSLFRLGPSYSAAAILVQLSLMLTFGDVGTRRSKTKLYSNFKLLRPCIVPGAHTNWLRVLTLLSVTLKNIYLVDPASSHMLVSKIKPCMSKYGSLNQLWFVRSSVASSDVTFG